jgi:hypothetical protein
VFISLQPAMTSSDCLVPGAADAADAGDAAKLGCSTEVWTHLQGHHFVPTTLWLPISRLCNLQGHVVTCLRQAEDGLLDAQAVQIDVNSDDVCVGLQSSPCYVLGVVDVAAQLILRVACTERTQLIRSCHCLYDPPSQWALELDIPHMSRHKVYISRDSGATAKYTQHAHNGVQRG